MLYFKLCKMLFWSQIALTLNQSQNTNLCWNYGMTGLGLWEPFVFKGGYDTGTLTLRIDPKQSFQNYSSNFISP